MSPTVTLILVVLVLCVPLVLILALVPTLSLVPALVLALGLVLALLGLALSLATVARWALVALPFLRDPAPLIEGAALLGFAFLLRPHLGLLAAEHLVRLAAVRPRLAQLPPVLALERPALLAHALLEAALLGLLTPDHRARGSRFAFGRELGPPFPDSGNPRAVDLDGAPLNRDVPQIRGTRIHDPVSLEGAPGGALEDAKPPPSNGENVALRDSHVREDRRTAGLARPARRGQSVGRIERVREGIVTATVDDLAGAVLTGEAVRSECGDVHHAEHSLRAARAQ